MTNDAEWQALCGVIGRPELATDPRIADSLSRHRHTHPDGVQHPYITTPARFSRTPAGVRTPGPLLGEHNDYILGQLLGLAPEDIRRLEASGVTATLSTDLSAEVAEPS